MNTPNIEMENRIASRLLDVLIRASLLVLLAVLCYRVFAPFLTLMVWAVILAITLYPAQQWLEARFGGRPGLAATTLVVLALAVIVTPTAILTGSLGDSIHELFTQVQNNTLKIPPPHISVASWPIVGEKLHGLWLQAHDNLPALVQSQQPKIAEIAKWALGVVAGIGLSILQFIASLAIAGILMAFGSSGGAGSHAIFRRITGSRAQGANFARLATQTIRAVAQGVIGVAMIQAIIIGFCLIVAGVPWAGVLALVVLVLGIAQLPAMFVTLPAIGYLWTSGDYSNAGAVTYTILLLVGGMADNVLKPLLLGRGVEAPMPVILIGALGGMAAAGILGMFVGATLLALGFQIFMSWVNANPDADDGDANETADAPANNQI